MAKKQSTGYPSLDRPWLQYYDKATTAAPLPSSTMYAYIYENNKNNLDSIALSYFGSKISYRTLFKEIDKAAIAFLSAGIKAGDVVSFITITTPEMIYAFYALNKIGAIASMLDPRSSTEVLKSQIAAAKSNTLILLDVCIKQVESLLSTLSFNRIILISVNHSMGFPVKQFYLAKMLFIKKHSIEGPSLIGWGDFLKNTKYLPPAIYNSEATSPALITYTGGTTGIPKGVVLSNLNINSVAEQYKNASSSLSRGQSWLTVSAPFIAYALIVGLHLPLSYGMECCIELYEPETMVKNIVRKRINHIAVTPIIFEKMITLPFTQKKDLSFLIAPTCGADTLNILLEQKINQFLFEHGCKWKVCQGYGMTELGTGISINVSQECSRPGSVGIPFGHTVVSTFDVTTGVEQKVGTVGEICVQGPSVMLGYYNDPSATSLVIRQHTDGSFWFHTGDLGHLDEDGFLYINGRMKRMIIRFDGFKVFPSTVEEALLKHVMVDQCVVVGINDLHHNVGQLPVAFIVPSTNCNLKQNELISLLQNHCDNLLPQYERPVAYYFRTFFPLTAANKIDYRLLEQETFSLKE